jgi:ADP-heptose:LPS heptosyltransferase
METPSLCDLAEVLRRAALFVGSDSGPTHLASILGVPCVALFGPKDPAINGPVGERSIVVRKNLPCSPCNKRTCKYPDCMKLITVSEVLSAAEQVFLKRELSRQEPVTVLKAR